MPLRAEMCGIVGYIGKEAPKMVVEALKSLEYRGYDSCGLAVGGEELKLFKGVGGPSEVFTEMPSLEGELAIGHTRWATHGEVSKENAHPFLQGDTILVHNGVTSNYLQLKNALPHYEFISSTDSEVLAALIDTAFEEAPIERSLLEKIDSIKGEFALLFLRRGERRIYFAVRGQPLVVSEDFTAIASDPVAFSALKRSGRYLPINDNSVGFIDGALHLFRGSVGKPFPIPSGEAAGKGNYPHFMRKEIDEQLLLFKRALSIDISALEEAIDKAKAIFLVAAGSSYNAARLLQHLLYKRFFSKGMWKPIILKYGHELYVDEWSNLDEVLFIALSQSGETLDVITPLKAVRGKAKIVAIVNRLGSTLASMAEVVVPIGAETEIGVAATKSYLNQVLLSYRLAAYSLDASQVAESIEEALSLEEVAKSLSPLLSEASHIFVLGKGIFKYIAAEVKLKIQELTYLPIESLPSGELKHGPLATVDGDALVIALLPPSTQGLDALGELIKVLARGGKVIALAPTSLKDELSLVEQKYPSIRVVYFSSPMPVVSYTVFGQLLAYHTAVSMGKNPDKPRNLAKSVTVR